MMRVSSVWPNPSRESSRVFHTKSCRLEMRLRPTLGRCGAIRNEELQIQVLSRHSRGSRLRTARERISRFVLAKLTLDHSNWAACGRAVESRQKWTVQMLGEA